jgi:hypothetical protein
VTDIVFGSPTSAQEPAPEQLALDCGDKPLRKGNRVKHKITGWPGRVDSVRRTGVPKVTVIWDKGGQNTIPYDSVERLK